MSELTKLLEGVNVEWKSLGEIAKITIGAFVHQNLQDKSAKFPVYNGGITPTGNYSKYNNTGNKLIVSARGANAGYVNKITTPYWAGNSCYSISIINEYQISWIFIYYFLKANELNLIGSQQKGGIPAVSKKQMETLKIPIPCPDNPEKSLKIQEEIVRILDRLSDETNQLTAALQKELDLHQKKYNFYREELFKFEGKEVEWKNLGDVAELVRGNGLPKSDFTETGVPAIHYGQIYTYYKTFTTETKSFVSPETAVKLRKVDSGDIVITNTSENLEDVGKAVAYLGDVQAVTGGHATIIKPSKEIIAKYFAYFTQTEAFAVQKKKLAKGIKVIDVSAKDMSKIKIPIPPIEVQARIVSILDKTDILTNSLGESLMKEIALRNKQYEYYRDRLLSFHSLQSEAEAIQ